MEKHRSLKAKHGVVLYALLWVAIVCIIIALPLFFLSFALIAPNAAASVFDLIENQPGVIFHPLVIIFYTLWLLLILGYIFFGRFNPSRSLKLSRPTSKKIYLVVLALALPTSILADQIATLVSEFLPINIVPVDTAAVEVFENLFLFGNTPLTLILPILTIAALPAIVEELIFRGFILSALETRFRAGLAILFTSFLFGPLHLNPQAIIGAAIVGFYLGWLAIRSKSIYPCMLAHFVNNGLALLVVNKPELFGVLERGGQTLLLPTPILLTSLILLVIGVAKVRQLTS